MNRRKKINQILIARHKKKNAKLKNSNKPRYISKADRAKLEDAQQISDEDTGTILETIHEGV